jgi:hypothetical protein
LWHNDMLETTYFQQGSWTSAAPVMGVCPVAVLSVGRDCQARRLCITTRGPPRLSGPTVNCQHPERCPMDDGYKIRVSLIDTMIEDT